MMRSTIIALFACAAAVKMETRNESVLNTVYNMLASMIQSAEVDTGKYEKQCAKETTEMDLQKEELRSNLNRLIGSEKIPGADSAECSANGCAGEFGAADTRRAACEATSVAEGTKATEADEAMRVHKYGDSALANCADGDPADADLSACATRSRIDTKNDQESTVAKQCKKTNEIMEIAINIYKAKGLGTSFIQLSQEENVMESAKAFLQEAESQSSGTGRDAELLKLLHDFHQQVKRDCHQDISDIRADVHALNMHLTAKENSAASEKRAFDTATQRKHEADTCVATEVANMASIHAAALADYTSFYTLCPPTAGCDDASAADWACAATSADDRATCAGSIMKKQADCAKIANDMSSYSNKMKGALATILPMVGMNGDSAQANSFIQLAQDVKAAPAMVQQGEGAVNFDNLVGAINQAMKNEIDKLAADATDVNLFAQQCEQALQPLDIPEVGSEDITGCTVGGGSMCADESPLPDTCAVCLQESQCETLEDEAIAAANSEQQKQNEQDAQKEKYDDAVANYAAHSRMDAEARAEHNRRTLEYNDNHAALNGAKTQITNWMNDAANANNINQGELANFMSVLDNMVEELKSTFDDYDAVETNRQTTWDSSAPTNPQSEAYWTTKTNTDCTGADAGSSYFCLSEAAKADKLDHAAVRASKENSIFHECTRTDGTLNKMKANLEARKAQCKVGVTKDLQEELHKMTEALQILQSAKTKIAGTK